MRKSLLSLVLLWMASVQISQAQTKFVGEIVAGNPVLTMNKAEMLKLYNMNLLKFTGIDGQFTDASIKPAGTGNYVLLFTGKTCRSALALVNNGGKLAPSGISCTTTDCSSEPHGCEVTYGTGPDAGTVYCSPCSNGGKCTKTSTSTSLLD